MYDKYYCLAMLRGCLVCISEALTLFKADKLNKDKLINILELSISIILHHLNCLSNVDPEVKTRLMTLHLLLEILQKEKLSKTNILNHVIREIEDLMNIMKTKFSLLCI